MSKQKSSERLYRVIGLLSEENIALADEPLNKNDTFDDVDSSKAILVPSSQVTYVPVKSSRLSMEFAGLAAAMLVLVVGALAAIFILGDDILTENPPLNYPDTTNNSVLSETPPVTTDEDTRIANISQSQAYELLGLTRSEIHERFGNPNDTVDGDESDVYVMQNEKKLFLAYDENGRVSHITYNGEAVINAPDTDTTPPFYFEREEITETTTD
jgi:hypothetical protein